MNDLLKQQEEVQQKVETCRTDMKGAEELLHQQKHKSLQLERQEQDLRSRTEFSKLENEKLRMQLLSKMEESKLQISEKTQEFEMISKQFAEAQKLQIDTQQAEATLLQLKGEFERTSREEAETMEQLNVKLLAAENELEAITLRKQEVVEKLERLRSTGRVTC